MKRRRDDDISELEKERKRTITYLMDVKDTFHDKTDKYAEFVDVLKDFAAQRVNTKGVVARVKELFKEHPKLMLVLNTFLPKGYETDLSQEEQAKKHVELEEKDITCHDDRDSAVLDVSADVADLYHDNGHKNHGEKETVSKKDREQYSQDTNFDSHGSKCVTHKHKAASTLEDSVTEPFHQEMMRRGDDVILELETALTFVKDVKYTLRDKMDKYTEFLDVLNDYRAQRVDNKGVVARVKELIKEHPKLMLGFNTFLPKGYETDLSQEEQAKKYVESEEGRQFPHKTKAIVITSHETDLSQEDGPQAKKDVEFEDVRQFPHKIKKDITCHDDRDGAVRDVSADVADLYHDDGHKIHGEKETVSRKDREQYSQDTNFDSHGSKCVTHKHKAASTPEDTVTEPFHQEDQDHDRHRDKDHEKDELNRCHEINASKNVSAFKPTLLVCNNEYQAKPIHELDLSDCEQCTPSYRLLPKNYPIPSATQITKIGAEVLNDHWVSVNPHYSFKHMRKNQYEECLFKCEDDRVELDILLETVSVTARRVEELLDKINNNTIGSDSPVLIEDHLTALNLRCIECLYGDNRLDVMDVLKKNASLALPVILTRLKQKQEEWTTCRFHFNKIWAEVYAKNYHKSLGHRRFTASISNRRAQRA